MSWFRKPFVPHRAFYVEFALSSAVVVLGYRGKRRAVQWTGDAGVRMMACDRLLAKWWRLGLEPFPTDWRTREIPCVAAAAPF